MKRVVPAALLAAAAMAVVVSPAKSAIITYDLTSYGSDPIGVQVTLDDESMPGSLTVSASVTASSENAIGDILGLWLEFNESDPPLSLTIPDDFTEVSLGGLDTAGASITPIYPATLNVGGGVVIEGEIAALFDPDIAFTFGDSGIGNNKGDIQSAVFKLDGVSVNDIYGVAARVTSIGTGDSRGGSDKLFGVTPPPTDEDEVPEPATVTMMAGGLLALAWAGRRRKKNRV